MSEAYEGWAVVELMGHRQRAGRVSQVEMFGTHLLRLDMPHGDGEATEFYGGSSIYAVRPCTEEVGRALAERMGDLRPIAPVGFRLPAPDVSFDLFDEEDEEVVEGEDA